MKHVDAWKILHDYIDGELSGERVTELEDHIGKCHICHGEIREIRELVHRATDLPSAMDPPKDLWPDIAARIEDGMQLDEIEADRDSRRVRNGDRNRDIDFRGRFRAAFRFPKNRAIPAFAGAALLAVILLMVLRPWQPPAPGNIAKTEPISDERGRSTALNVIVQALEAECRQADIELQLFVSLEGNPRLRPVLDQMDRDLHLIGRAIADIRDAWIVNPEDPHLTRLLVRSYQAKVALQERMVDVSIRS